MSTYADLIDRVAAASDLLDGQDREHARRVVAICELLQARPRAGGRLLAGDDDLALKRELGKLTELLGRRATKALPAATLGRAALADLHGDLASVERSCQDCAAKLALVGF